MLVLLLVLLLLGSFVGSVQDTSSLRFDARREDPALPCLTSRSKALIRRSKLSEVVNKLAGCRVGNRESAKPP